MYGGGADSPITPTLRNTFDHEYDHDHHHQPKRSVMAKVKEKARRWRQTLGKKKHGHRGDATPAWGVSLDEDEEEWEEQDPEYRGAPMYQSETAPNAYRKTEQQQAAVDKEMVSNKQEEGLSSTQHPDSLKETVVMPDRPSESAAPEEKPRPANNVTVVTSGNIRRLADAVTGILLAPAYVVSGATQMIASKIQGPQLGGDGGKEETAGTANPVSMKQYLMHKLEPGEDERALSEVITEAISPRKAARHQAAGERWQLDGAPVVSSLGDEERASSEGVSAKKQDASVSSASAPPVQAEGIGVVQKVRGAVSSLIWRRELAAPPLPVPPPPNPPAGGEGTGDMRIQEASTNG